MDSNPSTPQRDTGSPFLSPPLPSPSNSAYGLSPFKRAISFDLWADEDEPTSSRTKYDDDNDKENEKIEFGSIQEKKYFGEVTFRITAVRTSENEFRGEKRKTIKFYGNDGTGEMAFTAFHPESKEIEEIVKVNKCVTLRRFIVSLENSKYPSFIPGGFEVKIARYSTLKEAADICPPISFNFKKISDVLDGPSQTFVDLLCVVGRIWPMNEYKTTQSRNITLTDESLKCIMLSLWNQDAIDFGEDEGIVVAIRRGYYEKVDAGHLIKTKSCTLVQRNYNGTGSKELLKFYNEKVNELKERKKQRKQVKEAKTTEDEMTASQDADLQDWLRKNPNY